MTNVTEISLVCPLCREPFTSSVPINSADPGPLHTDFRREVIGFQPRCHLIHTCPFCGYTASPDDFDHKITRPVARRMIHALRYLVRGDVPLSSQRYVYAARCSEMLEDSPLRIADYYLSAAWSAEEENQQPEQMIYRKRAIDYFRNALGSPGLIQGSDRATTTYLVGELYRRIGRPAQASRWLAKVDQEVIDPAAQAWIVSLAEQQKVCPKELIDLPPSPERT